MKSRSESMPGHLWRWHEELRAFTRRELMRLPVCRAQEMPESVDMSELVIIDSAIQVEMGGQLLTVTELIAIWPAEFGWYRVTGLRLGSTAFCDWPGYE